MPSIFSSHDVTIRVDTKKTRIVPHVSQRYQWDCGLACVAMVAAYVHPKAYAPQRAYDETLACAAAVLPQQLTKRLTALCVAPPPNDHVVGDVAGNAALENHNDGPAVGDQPGASRLSPTTVTDECSGLWTIHLALVLREMIDAPRTWRCLNSAAPSNPAPQKATSGEEDVAVEMGPVAVPSEAVTSTASTALASPPRPERHGERTAGATELVAAVSLFTTCIGVNPEYQSTGLTFYENVDDSERALVVDAFACAAKFGVQVQELLLSTRDIAELLSEQVDGDQDELLFICLVDARQLQCPCRLVRRPPVTWTQLAWSTLGYPDEGSPREYVGHYVVVCGYDAATDQVLYRDPATKGSDECPPGSGYLCAQSVDAFEHARSASGTDHDVIMAKIC